MKKSKPKIFILTFTISLFTILAVAIAYESSQSADLDNKLNAIKNAEIGETVYFGEYEIDNDISKKDELLWIVLDKNDSSALLITKDCIDYFPYHEKMSDTTWKGSSLRKWLNSDFITENFSEREIEHILTTYLENPESKLKLHGFEYTMVGGDTEDKVFLLTADDVKNYFSDPKMRPAAPTEYAKAKYTPIIPIDDEYVRWWLRTPGVPTYMTSYVSAAGKIDTYGLYSHTDTIALRPAIWVNINN